MSERHDKGLVPISTRITPQLKDDIARQAGADMCSEAVVIRRALAVGLSALRKQTAELGDGEEETDGLQRRT